MTRYQNIDTLFRNLSDDVKALNDNLAQSGGAASLSVTIMTPPEDDRILRLILPMPPSANYMWRNVNGKMVKSKQAVDYVDACSDILRDVVPLVGYVSVRLKYYGLASNSDLDNRLKQIIDVLKDRAFGDDNVVAHIEAFRMLTWDRSTNPYVEVLVKPYYGVATLDGGYDGLGHTAEDRDGGEQGGDRPQADGT